VAATLQKSKGSQFSLNDTIQNTVRSQHPQTVKQLAAALMADGRIEEAEFVATVKRMANNGTITLGPPSYEVETLLDYLFTFTLSGWLWVSLLTVALSLIAVTLIPDFFPLNVLRWVLGSIFVLYLPGFSLIQLLFPKGKDIDSLERFALSIGLSLALVPLIGLVLNYTPWGIRFAPIVASLGTFTVVTLSAAGMRKYLEIRK
jgi:hypothetical protein